MTYNKVIYGDKILIDLTQDTVTADTLLDGVTAHAADGTVITGTYKGNPNDEIDRILVVGLTAGNITSSSGLTGYTLVKTFSDDGKTVTTVQYNNDGTELGRTVKTYVDGENTISVTDPSGRVLTRTIDPDTADTTVIFKDTDGTQLGKLTSVHSDDLKTVTINVVYGE